MNIKIIQLGLVVFIAIAGLSACTKNGDNPDEAPFVLFKKKYYNEASYCEVDQECQLYDCSKCSNIYYLDKIYEGNKTCDKDNNTVIGCECVDNTCKRVRK